MHKCQPPCLNTMISYISKFEQVYLLVSTRRTSNWRYQNQFSPGSVAWIGPARGQIVRRWAQDVPCGASSSGLHRGWSGLSWCPGCVHCASWGPTPDRGVERSVTPLGTCLSPLPIWVNSNETLHISCLEHFFMLPQPDTVITWWIWKSFHLAKYSLQIPCFLVFRMWNFPLKNDPECHGASCTSVFTSS